MLCYVLALYETMHSNSRFADSETCLSPILCITCLFFKKGDVQSRVTFQSDEYEEISASDRHHLQPLLGYDWIAGMPY